MLRFYDDELHNLILVANRNFSEIIDHTSKYDFHPPVQYLLNKISLQLFGLNEFWLSLPSILLIILAIIICIKLVYQITNSAKLSVITGLLIAINPLILLWGSSIRWYPLWTFLIILAVHLFIKLWSKKKKSLILIIGLIITLSFALYTNYQTIPFLIATTLTVIILDFKRKNFINLKKTVIVILGTFILFIPYLSVFKFHIQSFFERKEIYQGFTGTSPIVSGGYFLFSVIFGNSIYPWQKSFIILFTIGFSSVIISIVSFYLKSKKEKYTDNNVQDIFTKEKCNNSLNNILLSEIVLYTFILTVVFLLQSIISSTLINRGVIFLPMLLITVGILFIYRLYNSYQIISKLKLIHFSLVISMSSLIIIWMIGSYNVFTKQHLHKSGLAIPLKTIITFIENIQNDSRENISIITTDPVLTYYLLKENYTSVLSPYLNDDLKLINRMKTKVAIDCNKIIYIQSELGTLLPLKNKLSNYIDYLHSTGKLVSKPEKIGYDPDYSMKSNFFASAGLEEWKYTVYIFSPLTKWDIKYLQSINEFKVY